MKILISLAISVLLFGCMATQPIKDTSALRADEGALVVGLHTNWEGHNNPLLTTLELIYIGENDSAFSYRKLAFKGKDHILVANLPAQSYSIYKISLGNRYADLQEGATFEILPGHITYIGDIHLNLNLGMLSANAYLGVKDDYEGSDLYMKSNYPSLLADKTFTKSIVPIKLMK